MRKRLNIFVLIVITLVVAKCATKKVEEPAVDAQWVEKVGADHNHEVLKCYEQSLKKNSQLSGDFALEMDADHAGVVTDVRVKKSLDKGFDACVVARARSWNFPWITKQTFSIQDPYRLYLQNGQPMAEFGGVGVDKEAVRVIVREHVSEVRKCYENRLRTKPELSGKLVLQWDINRDGVVANPMASQALDAEVDNCVIDKLKTWKFPEPPNNRVAKVSYPFVFSPNAVEHQ